MKRILFPLLLLLFATATLAQYPSFRNPFRSSQQTPVNNKVAHHEDYPTLDLEFDWNDSLNQWDSMYRFTHTYLPNGSVAESVSEIYLASSFEPYSRAVNSYNAQGLVESTLYYDWDGSAWQAAYRTDITYDVHRNITLVMGYYWNLTQWDTISGDRSTFTYVFTDRIETSMYEYWQAGQWSKESLTEAHYPNAQGWDMAVFSLWDGTNWIPSDRYIDVVWHDFDKDLAASGRIQTFDSVAWENILRFDCAFSQYDSEVCLYDVWNGSAWDSLYRALITKDSLEHIVLDETYEWMGTWELVDGVLTDYFYDTQGHTTETTDEVYDGVIYRNNTRHVFPSFFTEAPDPRNPFHTVTTYPNPATDQVNFRLELEKGGPVQIMLYDLQGRLRVQTTAHARGTEEVTVPISELLENGTYVYRIATSEGQATGKVVVQR